MSPTDWNRLSALVGEAHLELCRQRPDWARNLEHPPGMAWTWAEWASDRHYYPELWQWTLYATEASERARACQEILSRRGWTTQDERYHLSKFCAFYGRYDRAIDPPVNLGNQARRYPLHSRILHYFNAPVHAAVCLLERRNLPSKREAFDRAAQLFPELNCWPILEAILQADYETPEWYTEPRLTELEDWMETALIVMAERIRSAITLLPPQTGTAVAEWKTALANLPPDATPTIRIPIKYARMLKGRLWFYLHAPAHFDTDFLIPHELRRIGDYFCRQSFCAFWRIRTGEALEVEAVLERLRGELFTTSEVAVARAFLRLAPGVWEPGTERQTVAEIVALWDDYYPALAKLDTAL
jgi:hypothetical protein